MAEKFWMGKAPKADDFGAPVTDEFIDGKTSRGPWAIMTPENWKRYSITADHSLGTGIGQRYKRQGDGRFMKVEG